jgi:hypothetical protein
MAAMFLSRLHKRAIASIAGMAFLVCQSMALAHACMTMPGQPDAAAMQQPCHDTGGQADSNPQPSGPGGCHYASPAVPDLPVFSAADLPAIAVRVASPAVAVPASLFDLALLQVEPPPHSILHCCLRN